jgi:hypothetical protein
VHFKALIAQSTLVRLETISVLLRAYCDREIFHVVLLFDPTDGDFLSAGQSLRAIRPPENIVRITVAHRAKDSLDAAKTHDISPAVL